MKEIDYIYQNFDPIAFVKNLKRAKKIYKDSKGFNFLVSLVLGSVRDINQLKNTINLYQFTNISENKIFNNFVKKYRNNYSDKDIEKYFFEKMNVLNTREDDWDITSLLATHLERGEFFRHFKKYFEITFYGQVTYTKYTQNNDENFGIYRDYYCLHIKNINKYYLFFFQHCSWATEMEFAYVTKIFDKRPTSIELIRILKKGDKETHQDELKEIIAKQYQIFNYSKSYNRIYSEGYKLKHETKPHFTNEEDYFNYHNTKGESYIASNIVLSNPEKYFKKYFKRWKQVYPYLAVRSDKMRKVKDNKFFKFVMSDRFNYRNNKKFIEKIIYSYDDLEGFLEYIPKNIQESKTFKEEIRILRLFRGKNKNFIIKVFRTNKNKLDALAENYMPTTILNDPYLMMKLIKIDTGLMARIGDALKKNKSFMKKVMKFINK